MPLMNSKALNCREWAKVIRGLNSAVERATPPSEMETGTRASRWPFGGLMTGVALMFSF